MKYEKPDLEELDLELEGSFLTANSKEPDKPNHGGEGDKEDGGHGDDGDEWG